MLVEVECDETKQNKLTDQTHPHFVSFIITDVSSDLLLILVLPKSDALRVQQLAATADGHYEISRYPHFEDLRWSGGEGRAETVDMSALLRAGESAATAEAGDTDTLTDLPDDLQQLQQQLLEVPR